MMGKRTWTQKRHTASQSQSTNQETIENKGLGNAEKQRRIKTSVKKSDNPGLTPPRESNPQYPYRSSSTGICMPNPLSRISLVAERRQEYIRQAHRITQHLREVGYSKKIMIVFG
jgi:hypothetical protein